MAQIPEAVKDVLHKAFAAGVIAARNLDHGLEYEEFAEWLETLTDYRETDECEDHCLIGKATPEECVYKHKEGD